MNPYQTRFSDTKLSSKIPSERNCVKYRFPLLPSVSYANIVLLTNPRSGRTRRPRRGNGRLGEAPRQHRRHQGRRRLRPSRERGARRDALLGERRVRHVHAGEALAARRRRGRVRNEHSPANTLIKKGLRLREGGRKGGGRRRGGRQTSRVPPAKRATAVRALRAPARLSCEPACLGLGLSL